MRQSLAAGHQIGKADFVDSAQIDLCQGNSLPDGRIDIVEEEIAKASTPAAVQSALKDR